MRLKHCGLVTELVTEVHIVVYIKITPNHSWDYKQCSHNLGSKLILNLICSK